MNRRRAALAGAATLAAAAGGAWAVRARARPTPPRVLPPGTARTVRSDDGTALHVEEYGDPDGHPLVLVHAWMCSVELWHRQVAALEDEARIIAFDLRGHGRSEAAPSDDYSIEAFGRDLEAVLTATLGDGERPILAGHSMGAMTIAAWAHAHHDAAASRISGVALIGTGMGDLVSESLAIRGPDRLGTIREHVGAQLLSSEFPLQGTPAPVLRRGVKRIAFGPDPRDEDVGLVSHMVRSCDRRVRGKSGATLSELDVIDGLAHLDVPAVLIAGERDVMTPPTHAERLAEKLPRDPTVQVVAGCGHMVPLEADREVTEGLRGLLREAKSAAEPALASA